MSSSRGWFLLLGALFATSALYGCSSDSDDDDDDGGEGGESGEGAVLRGGSDGTATGGSVSAGGSGNAATGGTSSSGSGGSGATPSTGGTGRGGTGGSGNDGTGGSTGGTGGGVSGSGGSAGAAITTDNIGAGCSADADCGSGLVCITSTSTILGDGGPAGGLCSRVCTGDLECGNNAYCIPLQEGDTSGYCIEACQLGSSGAPKCHQRANVACSLLGLIPTATTCTTSDDCGTAQLCDTEEGVCGDIVPGCLPTCAGDFDCEDGQHCSFSTGLCTAGSASGLGIGELCDPAAATDPCSGFCSASNAEGTEGVCSALCSLNPDLIGCGFDGEGEAEAGCLFVTRLTEDAGIGDVGLCGALCDCNDDCNAESDRCMDETDGTILSVFGRNGYCRPLASDETESDSIACE